MDQSDINGDNLNKINSYDEVDDNLNEINSCDEVDDNLNKINSCDEVVQGNIPSRAEITKRRPLEMLTIPEAAFEQASKLYTRIKFDHWNHANL
ncbi:9559_t:CDS:1, partial [Cetraspora pellucida]